MNPLSKLSGWALHRHEAMALCWAEFPVLSDLDLICALTCRTDHEDCGDRRERCERCELKGDFSDDHPNRLALWRRYQTALSLEHVRCVRAGQVHGVRVGVVDGDSDAMIPATDALCTDRRDIAMMLLGADCPLIAVYAPGSNGPGIGLAHAGWKGTIGNIAGELIKTLCDRYALDAAKMTAVITPGICASCFEVDAALGQRFLDECPAAVGAVSDSLCRRDKSHIDLAAINRRQLLDAGLSESRVALTGLCTVETQILHSYRRDQTAAGRHALIAALR